MADMRRYLKRFLNNKALRSLGGEYVGVIAEVSEEPIRNRFNGKTTTEPIISFEDGWRLIPNQGMLQVVIEGFGAEASDWPGRRLRVSLVEVETVNRETGETRPRQQRAVMCLSEDELAALSEQLVNAAPRCGGSDETD